MVSAWRMRRGPQSPAARSPGPVGVRSVSVSLLQLREEVHSKVGNDNEINGYDLGAEETVSEPEEEQNEDDE